MDIPSPILEDLPIPTVDEGPSAEELIEPFCSVPASTSSSPSLAFYTLPTDALSLFHAGPGVKVVDCQSVGERRNATPGVVVLEQKRFRSQFSRLRGHVLVACPAAEPAEKRLQLAASIERLEEMTDTIQSLRHDDARHVRTRPRADYLAVKQRNVPMSMRAIVVDWMAETHRRLKARPLALHSAVSLLDRYLSLTPITYTHTRIQLVACACLSLANKLDDVRAPGLTSYAYITEYQFSKADIGHMEAEINKCMTFHLAYSSPLAFAHQFLALYLSTRQSDAAPEAGAAVGGLELQRNARLRFAVEFVCEMLLMNVETLAYDNALLGAASVCVALQLLSREHAQSWTLALALGSGYSTDDLRAPVKFVFEWMRRCETDKPFTSLRATRDKYSRKDTMGVGQLVVQDQQLRDCDAALDQAHNRMQDALVALDVSPYVLDVCRGVSVSQGHIVEVVATRRAGAPEDDVFGSDFENMFEYQVLWRQLVPNGMLNSTKKDGHDHSNVQSILGSPKQHLPRATGDVPVPLLQITLWVDRETLSSLSNGEQALDSYKSVGTARKRDRDDGAMSSKRSKKHNGEKCRCTIM
jgi:hypothetical protein